jgi:hypothetical protein
MLGPVLKRNAKSPSVNAKMDAVVQAVHDLRAGRITQKQFNQIKEEGRAAFTSRKKPPDTFAKGGRIGALGKPYLLSKKQRVGVRMEEFSKQDAETAKLVEVDRKRAGHKKSDEVKRRINDLHEWKLEDRRDSVYAKGGIVKSVKDVIRQLDAKGDWHNDEVIMKHSQTLKPVAQRMLKKVVEGRRKMPGQYAKGGVLTQVAKFLKPKPKPDPNAGLRKIRDDLDTALKYRLPNKPPPGVPFEDWARDILKKSEPDETGSFLRPPLIKKAKGGRL